MRTKSASTRHRTVSTRALTCLKPDEDTPNMGIINLYPSKSSKKSRGMWWYFTPSEFALTKSVLFAILRVIQARGTSHRVHSSFLLRRFVMQLVSLHLYHHYTYQNTAKRFIVADHVVTLSRNITRGKGPRW